MAKKNQIQNNLKSINKYNIGKEKGKKLKQNKNQKKNECYII